MSEGIKAIADLVGFEAPEGGELTLDGLQGHLKENYVAISKLQDREDLINPLINKAYGKRMKMVELEVTKMAKNAGLEVTHSQMEGKSVEKALEFVGGLFKSKLEAAGQGDDEKVKTLQTDLDRFKRENESIRTQLESKQNEFDEFVNKTKQTERSNKATSALNKALASVKWGKDVNDITKKGFKSTFNEKYNIAILDDGTAELRDKNDNRVQNPQKMSENWSIEQAAHSLAKEAKLWDDGKHNGKPAPTTTTTRQSNPDGNPGRPTRTVAPFAKGKFK